MKADRHIKRITAAVLASAALAMPAAVFAQNITDTNDGISIYIDDKWTYKGKSDDGTYLFDHTDSPEEYLNIEVGNSEEYLVNFIDEEELRAVCDDIYSDEALADSLSKDNDNVPTTVNTESVVWGKETHNKVTYYRYEKSYTARGEGYYDKPYYLTVFITIQNGKIYVFGYSRNYINTSHYADVEDLLNSVSYEPGEIKIKINGQRIYPDSVPILYEDRTLVPIRAVAETMGYDVEWDSENQLITLYSAEYGHILHLMINNYSALKDLEQELELDVPPLIVNDRTYLPLRAVAEAMDARVEWKGDTRTVEIWQY